MNNDFHIGETVLVDVKHNLGYEAIIKSLATQKTFAEIYTTKHPETVWSIMTARLSKIQ